MCQNHPPNSSRIHTVTRTCSTCRHSSQAAATIRMSHRTPSTFGLSVSRCSRSGPMQAGLMPKRPRPTGSPAGPARRSATRPLAAAGDSPPRRADLEGWRSRRRGSASGGGVQLDIAGIHSGDAKNPWRHVVLEAIPAGKRCRGPASGGGGRPGPPRSAAAGGGGGPQAARPGNPRCRPGQPPSRPIMPAGLGLRADCAAPPRRLATAAAPRAPSRFARGGPARVRGCAAVLRADDRSRRAWAEIPACGSARSRPTSGRVRDHTPLAIEQYKYLIDRA